MNLFRNILCAERSAEEHLADLDYLKRQPDERVEDRYRFSFSRYVANAGDTSCSEDATLLSETSGYAYELAILTPRAKQQDMK